MNRREVLINGAVVVAAAALPEVVAGEVLPWDEPTTTWLITPSSQGIPRWAGEEPYDWHAWFYAPNMYLLLSGSSLDDLLKITGNKRFQGTISDVLKAAKPYTSLRAICGFMQK